MRDKTHTFLRTVGGLSLAVIVISWAAYELIASIRPPRPASVLVQEEPSQTACATRTWVRGDISVTALARFHTRAFVISTERYWFDTESRLSPLDFALGWGPMSDHRVLERLSFTHGRRRLQYVPTGRQMPLPFDEINSHSANMHLVPADDQVKRTILRVRRGDIVRLQGFLIEAASPDGWRWRSSLSRTDRGDGACELLWVEAADIE